MLAIIIQDTDTYHFVYSDLNIGRCCIRYFGDVLIEHKNYIIPKNNT